MSSTEVGRVKASSSIDISDLVASFQLKCKQKGVSQQQLLTALLDELGFSSTALMPYQKPRIEFSDNLINYLKEEEQKKALEIADRNAEYKARRPKKILSSIDGKLHFPPTTVDKNQARYVIVAALTSFECIRGDSIVTKTDIMHYLDYSESTIYFHEAKCKLLINKPDDIIGIIYSALQSDILDNFGI